MPLKRNENPQGWEAAHMTSHRTISSTIALLTALVAIAPASASANSLLSGYGGPGAGSQAILGSTLIGGGGGGPAGGSSGSSGSSSGAAGAGAGAGESGTAGARGGGSEAGARGGNAAGRASGGAAGARRGHGRASGGAARAYPVRPLDVVAKPFPSGSGALGISAADLGYLLLVLALLVATGVVTRSLARAPTRPEGPR
jgi:hypothetical protein